MVHLLPSVAYVFVVTDWNVGVVFVVNNTGGGSSRSLCNRDPVARWIRLLIIDPVSK